MDTEQLIKVLGAITACVLALVALVRLIIEIVRYIRELLRIKSARLENGRWEGMYSNGLFEIWVFTGELSLKKGNKWGMIPVSGRIYWTLIDCSEELPYSGHQGKSDCEVVGGELSNGILTIRGTQLVGEGPHIVELSIHTINCPSTGTAFEGNSMPIGGNEWLGKMHGNITFSRKPIF